MRPEYEYMYDDRFVIDSSKDQPIEPPEIEDDDILVLNPDDLKEYPVNDDWLNTSNFDKLRKLL